MIYDGLAESFVDVFSCVLFCVAAMLALKYVVFLGRLARVDRIGPVSSITTDDCIGLYCLLTVLWLRI